MWQSHGQNHCLGELEGGASSQCAWRAEHGSHKDYSGALRYQGVYLIRFWTCLHLFLFSISSFWNGNIYLMLVSPLYFGEIQVLVSLVLGILPRMNYPLSLTCMWFRWYLNEILDFKSLCWNELRFWGLLQWNKYILHMIRILIYASSSRIL